MPGRQRRHVLSGRHPEQRFPGYSRRDSGSSPSNQKSPLSTHTLYPHPGRV